MQVMIVHKNQTIVKVQTTVQAPPFSVNAVGDELVPLQEPLKPGGGFSVPPAGIEPL
jgi:hypothetical protein